MLSSLFSRSRNVSRTAITISRRTVFNTQKLWCRENIPFFGFLIGSAAISFQVGVLYPWHEELSVQINRLAEVTKNVEVLSAKLETRISAMEIAILKKEVEILDRENAILTKLDTIDKVNSVTKTNDGD